MERTRNEAGKEPEQIRSEIEDTRERLGDTVDALEKKLSPDQLKQQIKDRTTGRVQSVAQDAGEKVQTTGEQVLKTAKENPAIAGLIALGVGALAGALIRADGKPTKAIKIDQAKYDAKAKYDLKAKKTMKAMKAEKKMAEAKAQDLMKAAKKAEKKAEKEVRKFAKSGRKEVEGTLKAVGKRFGERRLAQDRKGAEKAAKAAALAASTKVAGTAAEVGKRASDVVETLGHRARELDVGEMAQHRAEQIQEVSVEARERAVDYIRDKPLQAAGILIGLGALIGFGLRGRQSGTSNGYSPHVERERDRLLTMLENTLQRAGGGSLRS